MWRALAEWGHSGVWLVCIVCLVEFCSVWSICNVCVCGLCVICSNGSRSPRSTLESVVSLSYDCTNNLCYAERVLCQPFKTIRTMLFLVINEVFLWCHVYLWNGLMQKPTRKPPLIDQYNNLVPRTYTQKAKLDMSKLFHRLRKTPVSVQGPL